MVSHTAREDRQGDNEDSVHQHVSQAAAEFGTRSSHRRTFPTAAAPEPRRNRRIQKHLRKFAALAADPQ